MPSCALTLAPDRGGNDTQEHLRHSSPRDSGHGHVRNVVYPVLLMMPATPVPIMDRKPRNHRHKS